MSRSGIEFFPLEVGMTDTDDKIYALMSEASSAGLGMFDAGSWLVFGRYVGLLEQIYAEGFAIQLDKRKATRIATKLGYTCIEDLYAFVETCVEAGLFEESFWRDHNVITSSGIQKRYMRARKKTKGVISGPWALFDDEGNPFGANGAKSAPGAPDAHKDKDKDKDKENLKEEDKEEKSSSSSENVENSPSCCPDLACMYASKEGVVYRDIAGKQHKTMHEALVTTYQHKVHGGDIGRFEEQIASACPSHCRGHPEQVRQCFEAIMRSLEKLDASKCSDPWPLTKKILENDRRFVDA